MTKCVCGEAIWWYGLKFSQFRVVSGGEVVRGKQWEEGMGG